MAGASFGGKKRVLLVEDEFLIRWALGQRFGDAGFEVLEASDLAEARKRLADGPDAVLLDIRLPDGDGRSFLRELRVVRPGCPVIMMSAHDTPTLAQECLRDGAVAYVPKPFNVDDVVRRVTALF